MDTTTRIHWPEPRDGQLRITLLGSPHLANPGNDEHNLTVDDVLAPGRQAELVSVRDQLADRGFDQVALEVPRGEQAALSEQYDRLAGGVDLDDEEGFPEGPVPIRSESVQVGVRVARALDHNHVAAVDSHPEIPDIEADWAFDRDPADVPYPIPDMAEIVAAEQERLRKSSLLEVLRENNRAETLRTYHGGNIGVAYDSTDGDGYTGSKQIGFWYERNARMLENLRRAGDPGDEVLFVVGTSHVLPLKQLAAAEPSTCPRSPLELLGAGDLT